MSEFIIISFKFLGIRQHHEHFSSFLPPVKHSHKQASAIQLCHGRVVSINSRFYQPLPSLFYLSSSGFCVFLSLYILKGSILRKHIYASCSVFLTRSPTISTSYFKFLTDIADSSPAHDLRICYPLFASNLKDFS